MFSDGRIQLTGKNIIVYADQVLEMQAKEVASVAGDQHYIKGDTVISEANGNNFVQGTLVLLNP